MEAGRIKKKQAPFTTVPNEILQKSELSWKAKGLMCYLLSLPDNWQLFKSELVSGSKDGYDSMISAWNELEKAGYITTSKLKIGTLFAGYEYGIHETPVRGFPEPVFPETENPQLIKTNSNKTNSNKEIINKEEKSKMELAFDLFWKHYPVKVGKPKAWLAFKKLTQEEVQKIFATLPAYKLYKPWADYNHPHPTTYLNQRRFDDEIPAISQTQKTAGAQQEVYTEYPANKVIDHSSRPY